MAPAKRGRPSRPGGWVYLQLKLDPRLKRALELTAAVGKVTMTKVAHEALIRHISTSGPSAAVEAISDLEERCYTQEELEAVIRAKDGASNAHEAVQQR